MTMSRQTPPSAADGADGMSRTSPILCPAPSASGTGPPPGHHRARQHARGLRQGARSLEAKDSRRGRPRPQRSRRRAGATLRGIQRPTRIIAAGGPTPAPLRRGPRGSLSGHARSGGGTGPERASSVDASAARASRRLRMKPVIRTATVLSSATLLSTVAAAAGSSPVGVGHEGFVAKWVRDMSDPCSLPVPCGLPVMLPPSGRRCVCAPLRAGS